MIHNFGFNKDWNRPKKNPKSLPNDFDLEIARILCEAIIKAYRRNVPSIRRQAHNIMLLRTRDKIEPDTIERVVKWYAKNIGKPYVPVIASSKALRAKFISLQECIKRNGDDEQRIHSSTEALVKRLLEFYSWPKGTQKDLHKVVNKSLWNYEEFHSRVHTVSIKNERVDSFRKYLIEFLPQPAACIEQHMHTVNRLVCSWDDWTGPLTRHVFTMECDSINNLCESHSIQYSGLSEYWEKLKSVVGT